VPQIDDSSCAQRQQRKIPSVVGGEEFVGPVEGDVTHLHAGVGELGVTAANRRVFDRGGDDVVCLALVYKYGYSNILGVGSIE
jgi:hypothetical protein